jgi:hypothetical protein
MDAYSLDSRGSKLHCYKVRMQAQRTAYVATPLTVPDMQVPKPERREAERHSCSWRKRAATCCSHHVLVREEREGIARGEELVFGMEEFGSGEEVRE